MLGYRPERVKGAARIYVKEHAQGLTINMRIHITAPANLLGKKGSGINISPESSDWLQEYKEDIHKS